MTMEKKLQLELINSKAAVAVQAQSGCLGGMMFPLL